MVEFLSASSVDAEVAWPNEVTSDDEWHHVADVLNYINRTMCAAAPDHKCSRSTNYSTKNKSRCCKWTTEKLE